MTADPALAREVSRCLERYAAPTRGTYLAALHRFFSAAGIATLKQATSLDRRGAARAVEELARGYRPATVQVTVAAAGRFWRHLVTYEMVRQSPVEYLDKPKGDPSAAHWNVLQPEEEAAFLAAAVHPRERAVVLALLRQGWRVSVLCGLRWGSVFKVQVEGRPRMVATFLGKGGKLARHTLKREVLEAARAWCRSAGPKDPVFPADATGRPFTRLEVHRLVVAVGKRAGLPHHITPHGLRATFISKVIQERGIEAARQLVDHASIVTTQRYSRFVVIGDEE